MTDVAEDQCCELCEAYENVHELPIRVDIDEDTLVTSRVFVCSTCVFQYADDRVLLLQVNAKRIERMEEEEDESEPQF